MELNIWDTLTASLRTTRALHYVVARNTDNMLDLLRGQLQNASPDKLKALKKELRNFNSSTEKWNE